MLINLITGGSSGIGFECAKKFVGEKLFITGRNEEKLKNACSELNALGVDADYRISDVSVASDVEALFNDITANGELGCVLNSAGISGVGVTGEKVFNIDLLGAKQVLNETLKHASDKTVLILIASIMGHTVIPNEMYDKYLKEPDLDGAYEALKFYLDDPNQAYNFCKRGNQLMVKKHAMEFGAKGARILSISPGIIETPMSVKAMEAAGDVMKQMLSMTPAGRFGKPEEIANTVEFLKSEKASFISGSDILIDGGLLNQMIK